MKNNSSHYATETRTLPQRHGGPQLSKWKCRRTEEKNRSTRHGGPENWTRKHKKGVYGRFANN